MSESDKNEENTKVLPTLEDLPDFEEQDKPDIEDAVADDKKTDGSKDHPVEQVLTDRKKEESSQKNVRRASPFREWLSDNLRYILLLLGIAAFVALLFAAVQGYQYFKNNKRTDRNQTSAAVSSSETQDRQKEAASQQGTGASAALSGSEETDPVKSSEDKEGEDLKAADGEIEETVTAYFSDLQKQEENELIEAYSNIRSFAIPGPEKGTYVVFAAADYKYYHYEEKIPSLSELFLTPDENGRLVVKEEPDEAEQKYMELLETREEVQQMITDTQKQYDLVVNANADLKAFIASLG